MLILSDKRQEPGRLRWAVEIEDDSLLVIHAMRLRGRYREQYEEAKQWRR